MRNRRTLFFIVGCILAILLVILYKTVYPEPRNIAAQRVDFNIPASELVHEMALTETAKKYGDKVVQTFGSITAINGNVITLETDVVVTLLDGSKLDLEKGDSITVKGRCIGYDDLLEEVKLDQASIIHE